MRNLLIGAIVLAAAGYLGSKLLLHHKVEAGVDGVVLMISPYANVEYEGISSTMSGELTIDDIRIQMSGFSDAITIKRLGIDTSSYFSLLAVSDVTNNLRSSNGRVPEYFGIIAEGVRVPVNADYMKKIHQLRLSQVDATDAEGAAAKCTGKYGFSPQALTSLGYTEQVASLSVHFRRGDGDFSIDFATDIENMWAVGAELTFAGDLQTELSKGRSIQPRVRAMRFEYQDQSLNRRVREYCEHLGLSNAETVQAQLDALQFVGKENGIEFDEYVVEPYTELINGKSTLVVTANPSKPVSINQFSLYKPSDIPALLDLSAEAY